MASRFAVSCRRTGIAMGFRDNPPYTQHVVSRVKRWFGRGGSTNSYGPKTAAADVNCNGVVNSTDFNLFKNAYAKR